MRTPSTIHNTFVIERSFPVNPARIFSAFSDPAKKRRWFAENENHETEEFVMDFRAGGDERARYRFGAGSPFPGMPLTNDATYQDIVQDKRIVMSATMSLGDRRISSSLVTFEFLPTEQGTDLIFTHQGAFFEGSDGPVMRQGGWGKLLEKLATELS